MEPAKSTTAGHENYGLLQQGYDYDANELRQLAWGLRFTPLVCLGLAIAGLLLEEPAIHLLLAVLGIVPFWFPAGHPVDLLYNRILRPLLNGVALPPNPLPRRIACFMGGLMNLAIGSFFILGMRQWAFFFGGILVSLQMVVITTHFCLASWIYERALKLVGQWEDPASREEFEKARRAGAILIDVRGPEEFAKRHLQGAVNICMEDLENKLTDKAKTYLLYCKSGVRSQEAARHLKRNGFDSILNLGSMDRVQNWVG